MPSCDPSDEALAFLPDKLLLKTASMSATTPSPDASRPRASVEESACAFSNVTRCGAWSLPGTASRVKKSGAICQAERPELGRADHRTAFFACWERFFGWNVDFFVL